MNLTAEGVNEHGVAMCECRPHGRVHAWEPGEWCSLDRVIPRLHAPDEIIFCPQCFQHADSCQAPEEHVAAWWIMAPVRPFEPADLDP